MRRLARWLFNALTMLSLLLCMATVALWIVATHRQRAWVTSCWTDKPRRVELRLELAGWTGDSLVFGTREIERHLFDYSPSTQLDAAREALRRKYGPPGQQLRRVFPDWTAQGTAFLERYGPTGSGSYFPRRFGFGGLLASFVLLPLARALGTLYRRWRAHRLAFVGCCRVCSYDLTANVSGICPECGTTIVATHARNSAALSRPDVTSKTTVRDDAPISRFRKA